MLITRARYDLYMDVRVPSVNERRIYVIKTRVFFRSTFVAEH